MEDISGKWWLKICVVANQCLAQIEAQHGKEECLDGQDPEVKWLKETNTSNNKEKSQYNDT